MTSLSWENLTLVKLMIFFFSEVSYNTLCAAKTPKSYFALMQFQQAIQCTFQSSSVFETSPSNFHKITVAVMKIFFQRHRARLINYCDYKPFEKDTFGRHVRRVRPKTWDFWLDQKLKSVTDLILRTREPEWRTWE